MSCIYLYLKPLPHVSSKNSDEDRNRDRCEYGSQKFGFGGSLGILRTGTLAVAMADDLCLCKLCGLHYKLSDGRLHGHTFRCVACSTSERLLRRNLGTCSELQTWSSAEQSQFFRQINQQKKAAQNGRLSWNAIRGTLIKSLTDQRISKWQTEVRGKELPLSVWLSQGWDEAVVKKQPCSWNEQLGVDVYTVPIRETTWAEEFQRIEKQILSHEAAAAQARTKKKKGKKAAGENGDSSDGDLDLPFEGQSSGQAGTEDKSKLAAQKKLVQSNLAVCNTAAKALGFLQSSFAALNTLWDKSSKHHAVMPEGLKSTVKEHMEKLDAWGTAARLVVNTHENARHGEGEVSPLPALPFGGEELKTLMKQQQEVMKAIRTAVPKKEPKCKAAPSPKAKVAEPKKRAVPEPADASKPKRRSQKGPE